MIRRLTQSLLALVVLVALLAVITASGPIIAGAHDDKTAVKRAVLDYVEGIYPLDPSSHQGRSSARWPDIFSLRDIATDGS